MYNSGVPIIRIQLIPLEANKIVLSSLRGLRPSHQAPSTHLTSDSNPTIPVSRDLLMFTRPRLLAGHYLQSSKYIFQEHIICSRPTQIQSIDSGTSPSGSQPPLPSSSHIASPEFAQGSSSVIQESPGSLYAEGIMMQPDIIDLSGESGFDQSWSWKEKNEDIQYLGYAVDLTHDSDEN